jgi:hypothetical protein
MASLQEQYRKGDAAQERVTTQYLPRSGLVLLREIYTYDLIQEMFLSPDNRECGHRPAYGDF